MEHTLNKQHSSGVIRFAAKAGYVQPGMGLANIPLPLFGSEIYNRNAFKYKYCNTELY